MKLFLTLHSGGPRRRAGLTKPALALSAAAALVVPAWLGSSAAPAAADQITVTRQQVAAAEAQALAGAQRVHALTEAYAEANLQASSLDALVATGAAEVARLQSEASIASTQLRREAVDSYTGAYVGVPSLSGSSADDVAIRAGYVSVASGDLRDSLDAFRAARQRLSGAQATLAQRQRESARAAAALGHARQAAVAEAVGDQARLDALQSELSTLEAESTAAKSATAGSPVPPAASAAVQGPPAAGGLVAVVKAEVTGTPPPLPAPSASAPAVPASTVPASTVPPAPAPAPSPTASTSGAGTSSDGGAGGVWLQLRECESGDNYQADTGNGYFGAYQFSQQTWTNLGLPGRPDLESPSMQDQAAMKLQAQSGWGQWPACSAALGLS